MVFGPVLGHIKILGQIQQPPLLVLGLEHPGRPRGGTLLVTFCKICTASAGKKLFSFFCWLNFLLERRSTRIGVETNTRNLV